MSEQAEIFLSTKSRQLKSNDFENEAAFNAFLNDNSLQSGSFLHAGTPYIVRPSGSEKPTNLMQQCRQLQNIPSCHRRSLANVNAQLGSDITLGLAELFDQQIAPAASQLNQWVGEEKVNLSSAAAGILQSRSAQFGDKVSAYEKSLMEVRRGYKAKLPRLQLMKLESDARAAWKALNDLFKAELIKATAKVKARKGTVFTNPQRAIDKAKGNRTDASIKLSNAKELKNLKHMSTGLKLGGNILLAADVADRGQKVKADFDQGKDWGKTASVQAAGLSAAVITGSVVAKGVISGAGAAALSIGLTMTPVGWAIVVCIGIGAAYVAATKADEVAQREVKNLYERNGIFNRIPRSL
ncbi:hypothetical protein [Agarivorans albus]|uniref:Uncharacterized protein n=1 Tax=Agarivorans albus MKT 106 TaxID=1331007 RepID=R9PQL2_AGAAL|nr:hypothetical protein [Agarivorans albus]GAD03600.1 hypothetical protein AALB_3680 [Agarivorans albus MKT 106]